MFSTFLALTFLFLMFMWSLAWVNYYNKLDKRFGSSLWRWSYDYPVTVSYTHLTQPTNLRE